MLASSLSPSGVPYTVLGLETDTEDGCPVDLIRPLSCSNAGLLADDVVGVFRTAAPVAAVPVAGLPTSTKNAKGRGTPAASVGVGLLGSVADRHTPLSPFSSTILKSAVVTDDVTAVFTADRG